MRLPKPVSAYGVPVQRQLRPSSQKWLVLCCDGACQTGFNQGQIMLTRGMFKVAVATAVFGSVHGALASRAVKRLASRAFGERNRSMFDIRFKVNRL